jgi:hypothetical protein
VIDFVSRWSEKTEIPATQFVAWLGLSRGKFYAWRRCYGRALEHNGQVPRDHWLLMVTEKRRKLDTRAGVCLQAEISRRAQR